MSISLLTPEVFRKKIAGLVDESRDLSESDIEDMKSTAVRFVSILASLFGDDLDRKTLWERIGSGISVGIAKSGDDASHFANECLMHIKAAPGEVAASAPMTSFMLQLDARPQSWHKQFLGYIHKHNYIIVMYARARWEEYKSGRIEL